MAVLIGALLMLMMTIIITALKNRHYIIVHCDCEAFQSKHMNKAPLPTARMVLSKGEHFSGPECHATKV